MGLERKHRMDDYIGEEIETKEAGFWIGLIKFIIGLAIFISLAVGLYLSLTITIFNQPIILWIVLGIAVIFCAWMIGKSI